MGTISWGQYPQGVQAAPSTSSGRKHRCSPLCRLHYIREGYVETMVSCLSRGGRLPRSRGVAAAAQTCPEGAVRHRGSSLVFTASSAQYRHGNDAHQSKRSSTSRVGPQVAWHPWHRGRVPRVALCVQNSMAMSPFSPTQQSPKSLLHPSRTSPV